MTKSNDNDDFPLGCAVVLAAAIVGYCLIVAAGLISDSIRPDLTQETIGGKR